MTHTTTIQRESREVRPFFVQSNDDDGVLVDVTDGTVEVGFARSRSRPSTWASASWASGGPFETPIGDAWIAEAELGGVGSGAAVELEPGQWVAFVRVDTGIEQPVLVAGVLTVQ